MIIIKGKVVKGPNVVRDGLVMQLDAANPRSYPGSGTSWFDLSGNNITANLINDPLFSSEKGGSILFDGLNEYASLLQSSTITNLTTNFTVEAVVRFSTSGGQYGIFSKGGGFIGGWVLYLRQGPQFAFIGYDNLGNSSGIKATPSGEISNNTWYHLVYTYNSSSIIGYINGVVKHNSSYNSTFSSSSTNNYIALDVNLADPRHFPGNIVKISLYNRALSAAEVVQNFNATRSRFGI